MTRFYVYHSASLWGPRYLVFDRVFAHRLVRSYWNVENADREADRLNRKHETRQEA